MTYDPVDANDDGIVESDVDNESVKTGGLVTELDESLRGAVDGRPMWSKAAKTLYVDPSGDDDNDGSSSSPLETIQAALDELAYHQLHDFRINLAPGVYDGTDNIQAGPCMANHTTDCNVDMVGDPSAPSDYQINVENVSSQVYGGVPSGAFEIRGVEINGKVQNYEGTLSLEDCNLNSTSNTSRVQAAVGGYSGNVRLAACTFGGDAEYAVELAQGQRISLLNCDGSVTNTIVKGRGSGGTAALKFGRPTAPNGTVDDSDRTPMTVIDDQQMESYNGEWQTPPGKGLVAQTPDGTAFYRIRVDNNGNLVTEETFPV